MWQALMDWLPDLHVGTFEIRDFLSLVVGGLGVFLAYLAIRMGRNQAEEARRQGEVALRQLDIADKQDRIMQEQLNRKAVLELVCQMSPVTNPQMVNRAISYDLFVYNYGNKTCRGLRWTMFMPADFMELFEFENGEATIHRPWSDRPEDTYRIEGVFDEPVFPGEHLLITTFKLQKALELPGRGTRVHWTVVSEDGRVPADKESPKAFHFFQDQMFPNLT